jgi:hypothetical protein
MVLTFEEFGISFSAWAQDFSLLHKIRIGFGAHPASYTRPTVVCFSGGKAAGRVKLATPFYLVPRPRMVSLRFHPIIVVRKATISWARNM